MNKENINEFIHNNDIRNKEIELIEKLIKLRYEHELSQRDLAEKSNIKQPVIANLERANHSPTLNTILKILDVYGYKLDIKKEK